MEKTTRRNLLKAAAIGGVTATGLSAALGAEQKPGKGNEHAHDNRPLSGKGSHTVVAFGQWDASPAPAKPHDRQPIISDRFRNLHLMLPFEAEVEEGGAVSFIISGLHQVVIYEGREFADLKADWVAAGNPVLPGLPANPPLFPFPLPPLIEMSVGRIYRGLDPRVLQYVPYTPAPGTSIGNLVQDRVEVVNFGAPGRYLVVCGVEGHFNEGMHGYVNVKA